MVVSRADMELAYYRPGAPLARRKTLMECKMQQRCRNNEICNLN